MDLRTANVTRYILPLREGGSLPALAEADDEFKYVVKFRGAGHGTKALIAELIGGEIARALAVSYTHLDVYKRQGRFRKNPSRCCPCSTWAIYHNIVGSFIPNAYNNIILDSADTFLWLSPKFKLCSIPVRG